MVNVHEGSFKEGVGRCYVNFMRVVQGWDGAKDGCNVDPGRVK